MSQMARRIGKAVQKHVAEMSAWGKTASEMSIGLGSGLID